MFKTDMIAWQSIKGNSTTTDLLSTSHNPPDVDEQQDYYTKVIYNKSHSIFTSDRLINTWDSEDT